MDELQKLVENAGIVQEKRFGSSEQMLSFVVGKINQIIADSQQGYTTVADVLHDLDDLIEIIDDSDVG